MLELIFLERQRQVKTFLCWCPNVGSPVVCKNVARWCHPGGQSRLRKKGGQNLKQCPTLLSFYSWCQVGLLPFFFLEQKLSLAFHRVCVCDLYLRLLRSDIVFDSAYPFFWGKSRLSIPIFSTRSQKRFSCHLQCTFRKKGFLTPIFFSVTQKWSPPFSFAWRWLKVFRYLFLPNHSQWASISHRTTW